MTETIDRDAIRARVGRVGDEPLTSGRQGGYWAIAIFRADSWKHDVLADDGRKEPMLYADIFAHARDDIRDLLAEVERLRVERDQWVAFARNRDADDLPRR